jgi:hypothetical protein
VKGLTMSVNTGIRSTRSNDTYGLLKPDSQYLLEFALHRSGGRIFLQLKALKASAVIGDTASVANQVVIVTGYVCVCCARVDEKKQTQPQPSGSRRRPLSNSHGRRILRFTSC